MPVSNAVLFRQLENWGFRSGKTKYGRILMRGPTGGHVLAPRPEVNGLADTSVVHNASRLLGVSVDRFWLGPLDALPAFDYHTEPEMDQVVHPATAIGATNTGRPSSSKRFASSYQAEILRYLDGLPGAVLEDQRMGVARAIWSVLGKSSGQNLSSCGSLLSALENDGRVVSSYGHRSLDGKLCRVKVSVLAEPPVGLAVPPVYPVELSLLSGTHNSHARAEYEPRAQDEREAELTAHIAHLSEEIMLWEDMAVELEASLVEAKQGQLDETSFMTALDEISRDLERKDVMIRWRDRQVGNRDAALRRKDAAISMLSREFHEVRVDYERVKSAHDSSARERERLNQRVTAVQSNNQRLQNELRDLTLDLRGTEADLERVQRRMFFSLVATLFDSLEGVEDGDLLADTWNALLVPEDPFISRGVTKHPFQSIIARSSRRDADTREWECPDLPRQSIYEQPVDKRRLEKELSRTIGKWYPKLLQFCAMLEDVLGPGVAVVDRDEWGYWRIALPSSICVVKRGRILVAGDKQITLQADNDAALLLTAEDKTGPTSEIFAAPPGVAARFVAGLQRNELRQLPGNDLYIALQMPEDDRTVETHVRVSNRVLQRCVNSRRIDDLLSHGNKLFGLREITPTITQSRKLAVVTTLLGMGGLTHMSSSKDDPREIVFNHGELSGLRGRVLYFHNMTDNNIKIQLHPVAHHDWHARLCVYNSDGTEEAEILIAVENDLQRG